jgi:DNA mismatch repair protein MutS
MPNLSFPELHGAQRVPSMKHVGTHSGFHVARTFHSILFEAPGDGDAREGPGTPDCFHDLHLDQIVAAVTAGRQEYDLQPFFHTRLASLTAISYRHEILHDLENEGLCRSIKAFSAQMRAMREHLGTAGKCSYKYEMEGWFHAAAEIYGDAVEKLLADLRETVPHSRGLRLFREYLAQYVGSDRFQKFRQESHAVKSALTAIRYSLFIRGSSITVRHCGNEADYTRIIEETFAKFRQGAAKDYRVKFPVSAGLNHVEAAVLERVALLNPAAFRALDDFSTRHGSFLEQTIHDFDREIQFYLAWLEYAETFKRAGLSFCYPRVSDTDKEVSSREGFDLALAGKLLRDKGAIVCNDFSLRDRERLLVVTGPNQGGKTTFARTFGQLHWLASLGCTVPGAEARLFLFDRLFTHFGREEDITTLRGKLEDDLVRIHQILAQATPDSLVIINEIFSATSVQDAAFLSRQVMGRITELDVLGVCVTFLDEMASLNEKTVSLVAAVAPDDPTRRTYRIERRPADGLAYAVAIAEKYRLTYARLKERLKP